jgi:beta-mannosidase
MLKQASLSSWSFKQRHPAQALADDFSTPDGWLAASVPSTIHQDLMAAGRIADPFIGLNERDVQWVGEVDWLYRCVFDLDPDFSGAETVMLCFDGLDTFATVWLNGQQILVSDNMFIPQRVPVRPLLKPKQNELWVLFESAIQQARLREAQHDVKRNWNGNSSRVYARKAQYHFGWDWGPCLITAGFWRPVWLEAYSQRIAEVDCPVEVAADLGSAVLPVRVTIEQSSQAPEQTSDVTVRLRLYEPAGELIYDVLLPVQDGQAQQRLEVASPALWWPNGYGLPALYRLVVTLQAAEMKVDERELRLGLRRLRLLQEPLIDQPGKTFVFEINNTPIFCGGANWIPADSFLPRVTSEQYRTLLQYAADAHMKMLRVWGGGVYEEEVFYDLCDELGLLVWQDFLFACAIYPAHESFLSSVRAEAEAAVRRLRHHACLALWCGNNEDYQVADSIGVYDSSFAGDFTSTPFPAREIYERLLPEICGALDPTRPYWPGSPYGGDNPHDPTTGDRHIWDVWHGNMADYHEYPQFKGRFISEFGMQALPELSTLVSFTPPDECYPQSRTLEHHNKADGGHRRLAIYLADTVRFPADLEGYIYATQFVQAEALSTAYRGWRRCWGGAGRRATAGALVWQLNDCWPVTSWSIVDYFLHPKPAYYVVRRELAPLVVGMARSADEVQVWAVNSLNTPVEAHLELSVWTLDGRQIEAERRPVTMSPNQTTECGVLALRANSPLIVGARLMVGGTVAARRALWPEPFKYFTLPDPAIEMVRLADEQVRLRAARPAKGVLLSAGPDVRWSDNFLDLLPDDEQVITARGLQGHDIHLRWLSWK